MDIYLPAEFYELREDLREWRDAPPSDHVCDKTSEAKAAAASDACADPSWKVI